MARVIPFLLALLLVAAACGDDEDIPVTTLPDATVPATDAPDATDAPQPTDAPVATTTAPAAAGSPADLAITEVVFAESATITNLGSGTVSLDGLWVCNRPNYLALSGTLGPGESVQLTSGDIPVPADGGEVALYSSPDFGSSEAILDYVAWGSGGGRLGVAADAGIWPDGDAVAVSGASISAPAGGASAADWS